MKYIAIGFVALVAVVSLLVWTDKRDAKLMQTRDCVAKTAQYNGYTGNVYSQEAWQLFIKECI